jgi:hypothetical protein
MSEHMSEQERQIRITLIDPEGRETSVSLPQSVVRGILGPDFIELPVVDPAHKGVIVHNFINVGRIRNVWIHDPLE